MKTLLKPSLVIIVIATLGIYLAISPEAPPASQLFINAHVLTMNADTPLAEAVAVEGDRILAVGSNEAILALKNDSSIIHDLKGKTLIPGIIDAHGHFPGSGLVALTTDLSSPPVGQVTNIPQLQEKLRQQAANTPPGEWVIGFAYDDTLLSEKQHPTRAQLDAVSTEHPVLAIHVSGHMSVANSLGLEMAGYDENTPNPAGGIIVKDSNGQLTGLLEEKAHQELAYHAMDMSLIDFYHILNFATEEYASMGVTTAQSGAADASTIQGLSMASKLGLIPFRLELWPYYDMLGEDILSGEFDLEDFNSDRVRTRTIKIGADGSIQGFTGYLSHPYHTPFRGDEDYRGYPIMSREKLTDWVTRFHQAGFQMAIHGNGDAAIDDILYAFEQAQNEHPAEDPRLILIHSQMARDDQLDKMKQLGVTPSFFSAHTYYWGDRHRDIFMGPERAMRMSPAYSAEERQLRYSVHLDTPVVPMNPMLLVWSTVNRLSSGDQVIGEEQRVPPMSALRAITIDAAWQIFKEEELGSIEVGKLADLVVLDGDPLVNPEAIREIQVLQTFVGGVSIFKRTSDQGY
jgi:predicted amidohydrolase YtcJ